MAEAKFKAELAKQAEEWDRTHQRESQFAPALGELAQLSPENPFFYSEVARIQGTHPHGTTDERFVKSLENLSKRRSEFETRANEIQNRYGINIGDYQKWDDQGKFVGLDYGSITNELKNRQQQRLQEMMGQQGVKSVTLDAEGKPTVRIEKEDPRDVLLKGLESGAVRPEDLPKLKGLDPDTLREEVAIRVGKKNNTSEQFKAMGSEYNKLLARRRDLARNLEYAESEQGKVEIGGLDKRMSEIGEQLASGVAPITEHQPGSWLEVGDGNKKGLAPGIYQVGPDGKPVFKSPPLSSPES